MTEFGALKGTTVGVEELNFLTDLADKDIQSWCYWQYKYDADITTASPDGAESFYVNGTLDTGKVKALSRTFAPIIAGTPSVHKFNPDTQEFKLEFQIDENLSDCTTIIFANLQYYYQNGISFDYSSNLHLTNENGNYFTFSCNGSGRASIHATNNA